MKRWMAVTILTGALLMTILAPSGATPQHSSTTKKPFGKTPDGQPVDLLVLTNKGGAEATITNYGGAVVAVKVRTATANSRMWCSVYDTSMAM